MSLISINDNCVSCGLCSKVCPVNIINMDSNNRPYVDEANEKACLECGQCLAVCPQNALEHKSVSVLDDIENSDADSDVKQVILNRRSIRHFKDEEIPEDELNELFDVSSYAPTGGNYQPVEWVVIKDKKVIQLLLDEIILWMKENINANSKLLAYSPMKYFVSEYEKGVNRISYDAPYIAIAYCDADYWHGGLDATITMSYLEMMANSMEIGTCWAGAIDFALKNSGHLRSIVKIPEGKMNHNVMLMGKSAYKFHRIPTRKKKQIRWI